MNSLKNSSYAIIRIKQVELREVYCSSNTAKHQSLHALTYFSLKWISNDLQVKNLAHLMYSAVAAKRSRRMLCTACP